MPAGFTAGFFNGMKQKIKLLHKKLEDLYGIPPKETPPPRPLDALIATILSQNTNDNNSYKAYVALRERFPEWKEMHAATRSTLISLIRVAGLAEQKADAIRAVLAMAANHNYSLDFLAEEEELKVLEMLTAIKGVGVKTASCVLLFSLQKNICPVDTHLHRVLNRIGLVATSTPDKTFEALLGVIPAGMAHSFHTNLIRHGRALCKAQRPLCGECPVYKMCAWEGKTEKRKGELIERNFMLLDNVTAYGKNAIKKKQ